MGTKALGSLATIFALVFCGSAEAQKAAGSLSITAAPKANTKQSKVTQAKPSKRAKPASKPKRQVRPKVTLAKPQKAAPMLRFGDCPGPGCPATESRSIGTAIFR